MKFRRKLFLLWVYALSLIHRCYSATNHKPYIDDSVNIVIKVLENTPVGTSILNITAKDQEGDPITFGLDDIGKTVFNIRNISSTVGELTLKTKLNRESVSSYDFYVTVTDGGEDRRTSKKFILEALDVNDNKPVFVEQPYWTSIPENTTVGTILLKIKATDADQGSNALVKYRFSNDSNSAQDNPLITLWKTAKFAIDNLEGKITLVSKLDYETTTRYLLPVVAEDDGNPREESKTTVVIDVTDISDNPPKFEQSVYLKEIDENVPVGTTVLTVVARDGDAGIDNPMKYDIYSGNNDGTFAIGSNTGVITVNGTIDAEKAQSYKLYVRASEVPNPSSNATVSVLITVLDKNDNPPLFSKDKYSFTLREDLAKPGRIVTDQLIVRDADKNPEFRLFKYHVTGGDSHRFSINPSSGELQINSTLDYETKVNYTLTVVATETGTPEKYSDNATIYLTLINDNDNKPIFANTSYYYTFDEEIPPGKEIAVITATDADIGSFGQVTYELRDGQSSFFAVDRKTGNITAARTLDYEEVHSYQFYLIASDGGGINKKEESVTINVTLRDINDNDPVFTGTPYTSKIKENLSPGVVAVKVTVSDKDSEENGQVSLNITSGNIDDAFTINATGFITTTKQLDREATASYLLTINASDHGNPPRVVTTTVKVDVLDENDNTPKIINGSYIVTNISENAGGGTDLFASLPARDDDAGSNGDILYTMSDADGRFILNSKTGRLQISPTGLDREIKDRYDLVINVTDGGSPPLQSSITVHVNILDINDNSPVFNPKPSEFPSPYKKSIKEGSSTLNTVIIQLNATDRDDGPNGKIIYSVTGDEHGFFSLDNITGKLTVVKELDREDPQMPKDAFNKGRFLLDVTATDQAEPVSSRRSATVRITIEVDDVNDNAPKFKENSYETHVSEAARTGSNVIQVSAEDKDLQSAGKIIYNITNGDPNGMFGISETGYINIEKPLDAENTFLYNLTVLAKDEGSPPLNSTVFAVIHVDDVNDNDPKFNQSIYTASVMENSIRGTSVLTVYASDRDQGSNGNVTFKISSGNQDDAFQMNAVTGVISTAASIDRETIQNYILTIQAEDQGQPSTRKDFAQVQITVEDENDNSPQLAGSPFSASIKENSPAGTTLALTKEIHATDADIGINGKITYSLQGLGAENFNINASTGIITTSNITSLDRERNASYSLNVTATDGGNKTATGGLVISITDVNDEPPRFAQAIYYANISEDVSQGSTVTKVTATDLDTNINGQIIYTSTGADGKFYVSRSTGNIIVDSSLDREFKSSYILNITAANIVEPLFEGHAQVHITVTDVIDDRPYFSTPTITVSLYENASVGTNVTRVTALDKDVGDTLSYFIADGDIYGQFRIDNVTGDIFTTNSLDRENKTKHILSVQARDSKDLVSEKKLRVEIDVTDVNDNFPIFTKEKYIEDYREQSPKDTSILKVTATDADSGVNARIRYSIVENVTSQISVDPETGLISQGAVELDREQQPYFNFTVKATDQGVPPKSTLVNVSLVLVDINDNSPKFANETYYAEVKENQPIGTPVFVVTATDDDAGNNAKLVYSISSITEFKIDPDRGNISTKRELDREQDGSYRLTLRVYDNAIRRREGSATLIVTILDVNDHPPVFSQENYQFEVNENVDRGSLVGTVSTTDKDFGENARVSYNITAGNEMRLFEINQTTGTITTLSPPDRETNGSFTLTITAQDHGQPRMESNTTVIITINDVNDNKPIFSQQVYNVSLKEGVHSGTVVTVSATDADIGNNGQFTFKITAGDVASQFKIDDDSGQLTLTKELDYEERPLINLTITATDKGISPLKGYAFVIIKVIDLDDNAPQFTKDKYTVEVDENIPQWSFVAQVNATDIDASEAHKTIHYRIENGNTGGMFAIGDLNGTIYLKCNASLSCLDRETIPQYELTLAAVSIVNNTEQKSTVPLIITVLDVNDVTPTFEPLSYAKTIPEDTGRDISGRDNTILTISAKDTDLGDNAKIVYSIAKGNEQGSFILNNKTGVLTKVKPLDRENTSFYQLVVVATDQGVPPLSSNTTVTLTVRDVNDNHPSFEATPDASRVDVKENITVGALIATVNATDKDEGSNAYIEYFIISGNDDGAFTLNKTSGELKTAKYLDHETTSTYTLVIQARNEKSDIKLASEKKIEVSVTDLNDNRPLFSKRSTTLSVGENLPAGTTVGKIEASDSDRSDFVYYYIIGSGGRDVFELNETSGIVTTKKIIDREQTPSFSMIIKASNYKLNNSSLLTSRKRRSITSANTTYSPLPTDPTTQRVVVEIGDANDNGPIFTKNVYTGGVAEDLPHGDNVIRVIANDADIGNSGRITYNFSVTTESSNKFTIDNETGWIKAADSFAGQRGKEYILDVFAKDNFGQNPYHFATATVKIYVLVDYERAVLISGRSPEDVRKNKENFIRVLQNITGLIINIDDINFYKENGKYDYSKTALYFHAVDPTTKKIVDRDEVIRRIDNNYNKQAAHKNFFDEWKIKEIKPYVPETKDEEFPIQLAVAIGLALLLFIIIIIFICIVCILRKRQRRKLRAATAASYGGSTLTSRRSSLSLPNTNLYDTTGSNPMWVDPYYNWGATDDDERSETQTFKGNGTLPNGFHYGDIMFRPSSTNPLVDKEAFMSMNTGSDETPDIDLANGEQISLGSRKSSDNDRPPSPEPYESSPTSEKHFYGNDSKYQVTSI